MNALIALLKGQNRQKYYEEVMYPLTANNVMSWKMSCDTKKDDLCWSEENFYPNPWRVNAEG